MKEHPREAKRLKRINEQVSKELERDWEKMKLILAKRARTPQRAETVLSWAEYKQKYQAVREEVFTDVRQGELDSFFYYLHFYPDLLVEGPVWTVVRQWWFTKATSRTAGENLKELGAVFTWGRKGRPKVLAEEEVPQSP